MQFSIYVKFKNGQKGSMVMDIRTVAARGKVGSN